MKINVKLSTESIQDAISKLEKIKDNIQYGLQQAVEILVGEGATIAQGAYGGMATATGEMTGETTGIISSSGEAAIIAEFGAGDTVINPLVMFENSPNTDVYPGAYSLLVGSKQYATYGRWYFGGERYTQVEPRMGLFYAKQYVAENGTRIAQEVIKL